MDLNGSLEPEAELLHFGLSFLLPLDQRLGDLGDIGDLCLELNHVRGDRRQLSIDRVDLLDRVRSLIPVVPRLGLEDSEGVL